MFPQHRIRYKVSAMQQRPHELDETEVVEFSVPLDLKTVAWLMELADANHASPAMVLASIIRDIRADDEMQHDLTPTRVLN